MKVVVGYPPNYAELCQFLSPTPDAIFCYGDTIYNPGSRTVSADIEAHEAVHSRQQGEYLEVWYYKYLRDPDFRLEQEIEAYGTQYSFARKLITDSPAGRKAALLKWALESMAKALSSPSYGSLIGYAAAESRIRNHAKTLAAVL